MEFTAAAPAPAPAVWPVGAGGLEDSGPGAPAPAPAPAPALLEAPAWGVESENFDEVPEASPEEVEARRLREKAEARRVRLQVRGVDRDADGARWNMGEDFLVDCTLDDVLSDVLADVYAAKGLHPSRVRVAVPRGRDASTTIEPGQYSLALRRVGITKKDCVLEFQPMIPSLWLWHPMAYYEDQFVREITRTLYGNNREMQLADLVREVRRPPPIRVSTRVFLRRWPDKFFVETHAASGHLRVRRNHDGAAPIFV